MASSGSDANFSAVAYARPSGVYAVTQITLRPAAFGQPLQAAKRDHAHTLSDFRVPTLSIECAHAAGSGATNSSCARGMLIEMRSLSVYDQCKIRYGEDSRLP